MQTFIFSHCLWLLAFLELCQNVVDYISYVLEEASSKCYLPMVLNRGQYSFQSEGVWDGYGSWECRNYWEWYRYWVSATQDVKDPAVDPTIPDMKNCPTPKSSLWNAVTGLSLRLWWMISMWNCFSHPLPPCWELKLKLFVTMYSLLLINMGGHPCCFCLFLLTLALTLSFIYAYFLPWRQDGSFQETSLLLFSFGSKSMNSSFPLFSKSCPLYSHSALGTRTEFLVIMQLVITA